MKTILVIFTLTLITSCTILENSGVVQRKYRPGFFILKSSSQFQLQKHLSDSSCKNEIRTTTAFGNSVPLTKTNDEAFRNKRFGEHINKFSAIKRKLEEIALVEAKSISSYKFPLKKIDNTCSTERTAINLSIRKIKEQKSCGSIWVELVVDILVAALTYAVIAIFPTLSVINAELIAIAFLVLLIIVLVLLIKD